MKNLLKIIAVGGLVFTLASCGTANDAYGNNYPNYPQGNGGTYRTPDGNVYRQGEVYRDRSGNVYENGRVVRTGDFRSQPGILGRNGTILYPNRDARRLPPGQAKKIYGGSAKDYAPGQVKKRNSSYNNGTWRNDDIKKGKKNNDRKFTGKNDKNSKNLKGKNGKKAGMRN